jgi:SSS family solute:Na+ symporter
MIANIFFRPYFPRILASPINAGAFTMLAGLIIVPFLSAFTAKPTNSLVDNCFACYEATVSVKAAESLPQD